jgi:two-component system sensor histidine kinase DesK
MMNSHDSKDRLSSDLRGAAVLYELPGWAHYFWLVYLGFLFTPVFAPEPHSWLWLWPTVISIPIFLFLYTRVIRAFRYRDPPGPAALAEVLAIAVMAYALMPFNDSANTYIIYCAAVSPFTLRSLRQMVVFVLSLLLGYALELSLLGFRPLLFAITTVVAIVAALSNFMMVENRRKNLALRLSREEMHRMARVAERERIGRDLHDLLGHTLSLIALKSELAAKLLDRDRTSAAREIAEVTSIAREALKQVRTAVAGIKAAALENEIVAAKELLSTSGIALAFERDGAVLPAEIETTLAMIVREAVTNIQRHSGARGARIEVVTDVPAAAQSGEAGAGGEAGARGNAGATGVGGGKRIEEKSVLLRVIDDGRGGIATRGNGLTGIGERVRSLGGTLEIDSPHGKGTTLRVRLPLVGAAALGVPGGARAGAAVSASGQVGAEVGAAARVHAGEASLRAAGVHDDDTPAALVRS